MSDSGRAMSDWSDNPSDPASRTMAMNPWDLFILGYEFRQAVYQCQDARDLGRIFACDFWPDNSWNDIANDARFPHTRPLWEGMEAAMKLIREKLSTSPPPAVQPPPAIDDELAALTPTDEDLEIASSPPPNEWYHEQMEPPPAEPGPQWMKPGWLERQIRETQAEVASWPAAFRPAEQPAAQGEGRELGMIDGMDIDCALMLAEREWHQWDKHDRYRSEDQTPTSAIIAKALMIVAGKLQASAPLAVGEQRERLLEQTMKLSAQRGVYLSEYFDCVTEAGIEVEFQDGDDVTGAPEKLLAWVKATKHQLATAIAERDAAVEAKQKAEAFKTWVHAFLDSKGVPANPDPDGNANHGCRISGRMQWVFERLEATKGTQP